MGEPVAGVEITVQGQTEYGYTFTRADGGFDLAVNGGGILVLSYEHPDYLPLHRQIKPLWADYTIAADVALTALDPAVTEVLADSDEMQVARGSVQSDADGSRQATVLFPAHTHATMRLSSHSAWGETVALSTLHVRATEYTVGAAGLAAMPATLPKTSGHTYAVELSVDEALEAGATRVDFSQPVPFYVENFLAFPVGEAVPTGPMARLWMPRPPQPDGDKTALKASIAAMAIAPLATLSRPSAKLWANTCQSQVRRFYCTIAVIPCRDIFLPAVSISPSQGHRCPRVCKRCDHRHRRPDDSREL